MNLGRKVLNDPENADVEAKTPLISEDDSREPELADTQQQQAAPIAPYPRQPQPQRQQLESVSSS